MFEATLNESKSRMDRLLVGAIVGLMLVGFLFIYSATMINAPSTVWRQFQELSFRDFSGWLFNEYFFRQMVWYGAGTVSAVTICLVDYRTLARWSGPVYWMTIVLLVAVLFLGAVRGGAKRWFDLGFFSLQPSEFAKVALILMLANFLSRPVEELRQPGNFGRAIGLLLLPMALIAIEPDLGSATVLLPVALTMMLVAGVPRRFIYLSAGLVAGLAALILVDVLFTTPAWQPFKLKEYQRQRLLVYFGKDFTPPNATPEQKRAAQELQRQKNHQSRQALISVGSGGLWGKGWCEGTQTSLGFLPPGAAHTDFIFSVIAEEKGFVGSATVIALYAVVLFTGLRIASRARDRLGKVLAVGVVTLLFCHVFINIGMNIRLMPVKGIPLPLLSYGGSSVLVSLIAMGLLHNVHTHRRTY